MKYQSTRDTSEKKYTSAQVIKQGIAPDGGLFVPDEIPTLSCQDILSLCPLSYPERAAKILSMFLPDYSYDELLGDCLEAYSSEKFVGGAAELKKIYNDLYSLELWHGPTAAFKDMALQIMPRLLSRALEKTGEKNDALILVATSGDTGKAALEGYRDIDKIKIMVFYPENGVSRVQKLQMATQLGSNVNVCAIDGNFDDAQTGVKKIFSDAHISQLLGERGYILSSANSINWGRLVPQTVYYISAYCDLVASNSIKAGDKINVCVPTGNFGNIFAAYITKLMGLPINRLVCASNTNNVLTDFLRSGEYNRNRQFHLTSSPSMDILISSNLERLIYLCAGAQKTAEYMKQLSDKGVYRVDGDIMSKINQNFTGYFANEEQTAQTIKKYLEEHSYLCDTHTAVGLSCAEQYINETGDTTPMVVASTASPYKFAQDVCKAITGETEQDPLGALDKLSDMTGTEITYPLRNIAQRQIRFTNSVHVSDMTDEVLSFAKK